MSMLELRVDDASAVAEVRRRACAAATPLQFDAVRVGQVALVATELATNLLRHAGGGRVLVGERAEAVEFIAMDTGRGMRDVAACLADGYSTAGSAGNGLGAVRRLSDCLEIASWPGQGTVIFACVGRSGGAAHHVPPADVAGLAVAKPGEPVCGDDWSLHEDADGRTVFMVDGLGHGTEAAVAANEAVKQFQRRPDAPPEEIVRGVHEAMRHTRGGAVAAARIAWASRTVVFAGVGNIAGVLAGGGAQPLRRMVSHSGTAGHVARRIQSFEYPCGAGPLIMHTDGLATSWTLEPYAGLARAHPMLIAGVLYRDFARGRDDATVVVAGTLRP